MPVQIDEVVITTSVNPQTATVQSSNPAAGADQLELERELADKILQIIRENSER